METYDNQNIADLDEPSYKGNKIAVIRKKGEMIDDPLARKDGKNPRSNGR